MTHGLFIARDTVITSRGPHLSFIIEGLLQIRHASLSASCAPRVFVDTPPLNTPTSICFLSVSTNEVRALLHRHRAFSRCSLCCPLMGVSLFVSRCAEGEFQNTCSPHTLIVPKGARLGTNLNGKILHSSKSSRNQMRKGSDVVFVMNLSSS